MKVLLRNQTWKIVDNDNLGSKFDGETSYAIKTIWIHPRCQGRDHLETVIHEIFHACVEDLDEESVESTARDLSRVLWKMGYRKKGRGAADSS